MERRQQVATKRNTKRAARQARGGEKDARGSSTRLDGHPLKVFWRTLPASAEGRLGRLIAFATLQVWASWIHGRTDGARKAERRRFNAWRQRDNLAGAGLCWACVEYRMRVWHHIIQLQHGGSNRPINKVAICEGCHGQVHVYLRTTRPITDAEEAFYRAARAYADTYQQRPTVLVSSAMVGGPRLVKKERSHDGRQGPERPVGARGEVVHPPA